MNTSLKPWNTTYNTAAKHHGTIAVSLNAMLKREEVKFILD